MLPVIELPAGDPFARGVAYGRAARAGIERSLENYRWLFDATAGVSWSDAAARAAQFVPAWEAFAPELLAEVAGTAEGAGVTTADLICLDSRSEVFSALRREARMNATPTECTALAVVPPRSDAPLYAQTWDWYAMQLDALVVLRLPGGGACFAEAGMLGKIGLNETGLAVGLQFLSSEDDGTGEGLPVHVLLRATLDRCASVAEALELLDDVQPAGSASIGLVDSAGDAAFVELSPASRATLRPEAESSATPTTFSVPSPRSANRRRFDPQHPHPSDPLAVLPCRGSAVWRARRHADVAEQRGRLRLGVSGGRSVAARLGADQTVIGSSPT